jgi:hypothetical protein
VDALLVAVLSSRKFLTEDELKSEGFRSGVPGAYYKPVEKTLEHGKEEKKK